MSSNQNPQTDGDYGPYADIVKEIKKFYSEDYREAREANGLECNNYDQWTKEDLVRLNNYHGGYEFLNLLKLVKGALDEEKNTAANKTTYAQNALTAIKPTACTDWKEFKDMIAAAYKEVSKQQNPPRLPKQTPPPLPKAPNDTIPNRGGSIIAPNDVQGFCSVMPEREFDQQTALAMLEKHNVVKDGSDVLKAPLETQITDAVKSVKSNIRAA